MKRIIVTILLNVTCIIVVSAQFDSRFYYPSKQWNNIENISYKELTFEIDTISINTLLIKPENTVKATVIYYHGSSGNISTYIDYIRPLVNSGYQVFMTDFRGYGKSSGVPTHLNIAKDAQYIFEKIMLLDDFKHKPIIIYGASMGTQIAAKIAKDNQSNISGLVLDGVISSFTDMALVSVPDEQKTMVAQYVTSPYSAKNDIKEIKLPKYEYPYS
ncbi:MAG: alpha/beta hydrolase [Bacteroidales bacterium]